jgi:hypothetical protein
MAQARVSVAFEASSRPGLDHSIDDGFDDALSESGLTTMSANKVPVHLRMVHVEFGPF